MGDRAGHEEEGLQKCHIHTWARIFKNSIFLNYSERRKAMLQKGSSCACPVHLGFAGTIDGNYLSSWRLL